MGIILAKTAGFCMGVKRAVDVVLDMASHKNGETIYTYGPLIHNPQTIELLRKRGIIPIGSLDEFDHAPAGATSVSTTRRALPGSAACVRHPWRRCGLRLRDLRRTRPPRWTSRSRSFSRPAVR